MTAQRDLLQSHWTWTNGWPYWLVLLACVSLASYLSLLSYAFERKYDRLQAAADSVASINVLTSVDASNGKRWLVDLKTLVPSLMFVQPDVASRLTGPLERLAEELTTTKTVSIGSEMALKRELLAAEAQLRAAQSVMNTYHARYTHFYYLAMMLVLVLAVLRIRGPSSASSGTDIRRLMNDEFVFPNAAIGMSLSDAEDRMLRVNPAYEQVTGFTEAEILGEPVFPLEPEGMRAELATNGTWTGEQKTRRKDGSVVAEKVVRVALPEGSGYLTMSMEPVVSDDERHLMLWQAHHDGLTKLPNANLLHERLTRALITNVQEGKRGALISIDLDSFQVVNDSVGHELADRVLTDAAYRIAMCARETDTVARTGGDLFVIAMLEIDSVNDAERIARAAVESMAPPFMVESKEIFLTASAGLTIFPDDGTEKGELLQKADAARLQAKRNGGNQIAFFEEEINAQAARRLEIETHLRRAVENEELTLHFQPIIDVKTGSVYGAEALLRWHSADLGFVSPGEFIPVAEGSGLIVEIGEWVVRAVRDQLAQWQLGSDWPRLRISLNVSAKQFGSEAHARSLLDALGDLDPDGITVELTESALVTDDPGASLFLAGLQEHGLRVALDDFGTGYSSIGYLRDFNFDLLKIDKSFIDNIETAKDLGLVASIIAMARILGMRVVAEGVENQRQADHLRRIGCDYVQGYHYAKPLPVAEFESFVMQGNT